MAADLETRVIELEAAVLALTTAREMEFGDVQGHLFHGNQWSDGTGGEGNDGKPAGDPGAAKAADAPFPRAENKSGYGLSPSYRTRQVREHGHGSMGDDTKTTHYKNGEVTKTSTSRVNLGTNRDLGPKARAVGLRDFDYNGPLHGLPTAERLSSRSYGAVKFGGDDQYRFAHGASPRGEGQWVFQHEATGLRTSGTGTYGDVKAAIRETFPRTGAWAVQT